MRRLIPVDGHVHIHQGVRPDAVLDHAARNFRREAAPNPAVVAGRGLLCLVRPDPGPVFGRVLERGGGGAQRGWELTGPGEEGRTVTARRGDEALTLVAGRQLATAGGLEVLAVGTDASLPGRLPLEEAVLAVREAGGVPVIPWGFGKWWFRRGRELRSFLRSAAAEHVFLGDNAGRLRAGPHLGVLRLARSLGIPVLPGTDPLPLAGHERRVGRYGFLLPAPVGEPANAAWLVRSLRGLEGDPAAYGELDSPLATVTSQVRLRLPG